MLQSLIPANGNNFGVVLIPEGLIEFIPAIGRLVTNLMTSLHMVLI